MSKKLKPYEITAKYYQDGDSLIVDEQEMEILTGDAGGGTYFIIKTERWAFDNIQELIDLLTDFKKRIE